MPSAIDLNDEDESKLDSNLIKIEINNFEENSLVSQIDEKNHQQTEISSGSSINITNFMLSSSSSCGQGSSSSSSLGANQDFVTNDGQQSLKNNESILNENTNSNTDQILAGSDLSSSSRRSSISGDLESKLVTEEVEEDKSFYLKPNKTNRKPKKINLYSSIRSRRTRRIVNRPLNDADADIEVDDESDVYEQDSDENEIRNDSNEIKLDKCDRKKFNCLDLDLFDYLLKRNFIKTCELNEKLNLDNSNNNNNNNNNPAHANLKHRKQRKLSLFTTSSEIVNFENEFETNLNINKYFYHLINLKNKNKINNNSNNNNNNNNNQEQQKHKCLVSIINSNNKRINKKVNNNNNNNNILNNANSNSNSSSNINEIKNLLDDLVIQIEKKENENTYTNYNTTQNNFIEIETRNIENVSSNNISYNNNNNNNNNNNYKIKLENEKSLIKILLKDMSSLNSIGHDLMSLNLTSEIENENLIKNLNNFDDYDYEKSNLNKLKIENEIQNLNPNNTNLNLEAMNNTNIILNDKYKTLTTNLNDFNNTNLNENNENKNTFKSDIVVDLDIMNNIHNNNSKNNNEKNVVVDQHDDEKEKEIWTKNNNEENENILSSNIEMNTKKNLNNNNNNTSKEGLNLNLLNNNNSENEIKFETNDNTNNHEKKTTENSKLVNDRFYVDHDKSTTTTIINTNETILLLNENKNNNNNNNTKEKDLNTLSTQQQQQQKESLNSTTTTLSTTNLKQENEILENEKKILNTNENLLNLRKEQQEQENENLGEFNNNNNNNDNEKTTNKEVDILEKHNEVMNTDTTETCNKSETNIKSRSTSGESASSSTSSTASVSTNSTFNNDSEELTNNVKKVVLKNNEVVLIEDCESEEEEDLLHKLKSKNDNLPNLINESPTPNKNSSSQHSSLMTRSLNSQTAKPLFKSNPSTNVNQNSKQTDNQKSSDDPYVKAALERFDAFCKSKSTHNLDQAGSTTPSFVLNRQKSPYLSRKFTPTQPNEDTNIKENITSFIKRRQNRIDPYLNKQTESESANTNSNESTINPTITRSVSESRSDNSNRLSQVPSSLATSSLAKKFLGSLTPQLEPALPLESEIVQEPVIVKKEEIKNVPDKNIKNTKTSILNSNKITKPSDLSINRKMSSPSLSSSSSSSNSPTASSPVSPIHQNKTNNKQVNIIKLEVFNSKNQKSPINNKNDEDKNQSQSTSKPPLPPTNNSPCSSPSTWRSKLRHVNQTSNNDSNNSEEKNTSELKKANETNQVQKASLVNNNNNNNISKSNSRVIPIEIKNSRSSSISSALNKDNNNKTSNISNSKANSQLGASQRSMAKSVEKLNTQTYQTSIEIEPVQNVNCNYTPTETAKATPIKPSSSNIQDRIRSLSTSYKENLEHNDRNMPLSFSRLREELDNTRKNDYENIYESAIRENPIKDREHDPIVEKACSNFMTKLMEFQRQHKSSYQPFTSALSTSVATTPTTPTSPSYQGPIISARNTNPSINLTNESAISPSLLNTPSTLSPYRSVYTSSYTPSYTTSTFYEPPKYTSTYTSPYSPSSYLQNEPSSTKTTSISSATPYVSSIRKRRTLFSDGFDTASTEARNETDNVNNYSSEHEEFISPYLYRSTAVPDPTKLLTTGYPQNRNRPLSIVNEESNPSSSSYYGLNRSYTLNDTRLKTIDKDSSLNESSIISNVSTSSNTSSSTKSKPLLKKSNSLNSGTSSNSSNTNNDNTNNQSAKTDNSTGLSSTSNQTKVRSIVFDRLSAVNNALNNNNNSASTKTSSINEQKNSKPSFLNNSNSKTAYETRKKEENEIAIVTSVVPKTRRESIAGTSSSNSTTQASANIALNRIRSLDSKSRDKFKSNTNVIKKTSPSNSISSSSSTTSTTANVPACYLYPTEKSITKNNPNTKSSTSIGANSEISDVSETRSNTRRKSQTTVINRPTNDASSNVFDRLSKRTNSMKNLANTLSTTKSKTSSSSSSSSEDADHKATSSNDETSNIDDNVFDNSANISNQTHNNSLSKTSVFERLYRSNIAAHMSHQDDTNKNNSGSNLKKNMSISSANLVSSLSNANSKSRNCLSRPKPALNTKSSTNSKQRNSSSKEDSGNEDTNEIRKFENFSDVNSKSATSSFVMDSTRN